MSNSLYDSLASRIRGLMMQYGNLSEADLARETQIPQPTIHRLISGDTLESPYFHTSRYCQIFWRFH